MGTVLNDRGHVCGVAIILREPNFEALVRRLVMETEVGMGTPSLAECGVVLASRPHPDWRKLIDEFKARFELEDIPFSSDHWVVAVEAYEQFGKGRHPARLNFGDCLSYGNPQSGRVRIGPGGKSRLDWTTLIDEFKTRFGLEEISLSSSHWVVAVEAYERFGKGRHPAKLNFGDCLSYAVARVADRPLLYIGNDFPLTDLWRE